MRCPRLNSCCLCCDLPTGVLAIGITSLVFSSLGILTLSAGIASPGLIREAILEDPSLFEADRPLEPQVEGLVRHVQLFFGLGLAAAVVCAVLDVTLLVGTTRSRARPLLAWVIGYSVVMAATIGFGLYMVVLMVATGDSSPDIWYFIVTELITGAFFIYLIMVVHSYYKVLKEREAGGSYVMQPMTAA